MKKLITLMILSGLIFTGAAFGQDERPTRDGERDGKFRIPRALRENEDIQAATEVYRTASTELRATLQGLRTQLEAATEENKAAIKEQIREQLKGHRIDQREFRKEVRRAMRVLREVRAAE